MELWKFRSCELAIYRTTPAPGSEAVRFGICRSQPLCTARTRFRSIVNFWRAQNWGSRLPPGPGITRNYYGKTHQVSQREKERERARKVTISQLTCFEHMMKMIRNFVAWTSLRLFITKENSYVVSWSAGDVRSALETCTRGSVKHEQITHNTGKRCRYPINCHKMGGQGN